MAINFLGNTSYVQGTSARKLKNKGAVDKRNTKIQERNFKTYNLKSDNLTYSHPIRTYGDLEFIDINEPEIYHRPRTKSQALRRAKERERMRKLKIKAAGSIAALLTASAASLYALNASSNANTTNVEIPHIQWEDIVQRQDNYPVAVMPEYNEEIVQVGYQEPSCEQNPLETLYNGAFDFELTPTEENLNGVRKFLSIWNNSENRNRYEYVAKELGIPAEIVAINHYREATGDFARSQVDGQLLEESDFSSWEESAIYAYKNRGIDLDIIEADDINTWFKYLEAYNGKGYRNAGINTPYVWSGTDLYESGKFISNGVFDRNVVDEQAGAALILRELFIGDVLGD